MARTTVDTSILVQTLSGPLQRHRQHTRFADISAASYHRPGSNRFKIDPIQDHVDCLWVTKEVTVFVSRKGGGVTHGRKTSAAAACSPVRVLVALHVRLYREAIAQVLQRDAGFEVVAGASDWDEVVGAAREVQPEVVLIDLPSIDPPEQLLKLATVAPDTRVIAIGPVEPAASPWSSPHVTAYLSRDASIADVLEAMAEVAGAECEHSDSQAVMLFRPEPAIRGRRRAGLTVRELEVLRLLAKGATNKQIATELVIELPTVKNHVHSILRKLRVHDRMDAVIEAWDRGLAKPVAWVGDDSFEPL